MNFTDFCRKVKDTISDYLPEYDISSVEIREIKKNNDIGLTGVMINVQGNNVTPNIYLEYHYSHYRQGEPMSDILVEIADEFRQARGFVERKSYESFRHDDFKNAVFLRLINYERNRELLADCPHIPFLDLAICFRYLADQNEKGVASSIVKNSDLKMWGISARELYKLAEENTRRIFPVELSRLDELLLRMSGVPRQSPEGNPLGEIYVLTNKQNVNGATCLLFKDVVEAFAEKIENSFYILPASVHEVMLVPYDENHDRRDLEEMVKEVNQYVVSGMDYLSDRVYFYDRTAKKLTA